MNIFEKYNIDIKKLLLNLKDENWNAFFSKKDIFFAWKEQVQIKCPFHNDKSPSLGINLNRNFFNCFVCTDNKWKLKPNWKEEFLGKWSFLSHFFKLFYHEHQNKEFDQKELFKICNIKKEEEEEEFLKELFKWKKNYIKNWNNKNNKSNYKKTLCKLEISELNKYKNNLTYIKKRLNKFNDLTKERIDLTLNNFNIWYDSSKNILAIPVFQDWYLRWIYGRRKIEYNWLRYTNIESFPKTDIIYNYDSVIEKKYDTVILVEGPLNAIRLWALGYDNVISLFWAKAYDEQIKKLNIFKNIYVWFDNDEAWINWLKWIIKKTSKNVNIFSTFDENWNSKKVKDAYDLDKKEIKNLFWNFKYENK